MNETCIKCTHKEVCSIYEYARKYNDSSLVHFKSSSIADVCGYYQLNTKYKEIVNNNPTKLGIKNKGG